MIKLKIDDDFKLFSVFLKGREAQIKTDDASFISGLNNLRA